MNSAVEVRERPGMLEIVKEWDAAGCVVFLAGSQAGAKKWPW